MKVVSNNNFVYKVQYGYFVEKENIVDSYIVWYLDLESDYEMCRIEHKQYVYYENLEESLHEEYYEVIDEESEEDL